MVDSLKCYSQMGRQARVAVHRGHVVFNQPVPKPGGFAWIVVTLISCLKGLAAANQMKEHVEKPLGNSPSSF